MEENSGAPGSNKSEYAARVAKKYDGYVLLSMSDLLRKKVRSINELSSNIAFYFR